ncbi:hypothetical protein KJ591_03590, partial [Patescibacteria group bacterium]|nr:hypothetical protein [Patescibacteria group bacterium]
MNKKNKKLTILLAIIIPLIAISIGLGSYLLMKEANQKKINNLMLNFDSLESCIDGMLTSAQNQLNCSVQEGNIEEYKKCLDDNLENYEAYLREYNNLASELYGRAEGFIGKEKESIVHTIDISRERYRDFKTIDLEYLPRLRDAMLEEALSYNLYLEYSSFSYFKKYLEK